MVLHLNQIKKEPDYNIKTNKEYLFKFIPLGDSGRNNERKKLIGHITDTKPKDKNFIGRRLFISTGLSINSAENRPKEEILGTINSSSITDKVIIIENIRESKFENDRLHLLTKQKKISTRLKIMNLWDLVGYAIWF